MNAQISNQSPRRTPLYPLHKELGARFVEFGSWEMPVYYSSIVDEHKNVREKVGLFDVSHMGEIFVRGPESLELLQYLTTNDVSKLTPGKAQYTLLLNEHGGVVDDLIIYMLLEGDYLLCVNASNTEKDFSWLTKHNTFDALVENVSSEYSQLALQGPKAVDVMCRLLARKHSDFSLENFPPFSFEPSDTALDSQVHRLIIARTGYTGEDGFEIFAAKDSGVELWKTLLEIGEDYGICPVGLGARDTLRLEACYPLFGHELKDAISPLCSRLSWVIKLDKGDFIGKDALEKQEKNGIPIKLVCLEVIGQGIIREGVRLFSDAEDSIGEVVSGTKTPTIGKAIGTAFVKKEHAKVGSEFSAEIRGKQVPVKVVKWPFYKRSR